MNTLSSSPPPIQDLHEQEIDLRDLIRVISKQKVIILTFLLITVLTVFITTFTTTPLFTASSQVLIERNYGSSAIERDNLFLRGDSAFLSTQLELIRSANVSHRVVKQLKLDTQHKDYFLAAPKEGLFNFIPTFKKGIKNFFKGSPPSDLTGVNTGNTGNNDLPISAKPTKDADIIAAKIRGNLSIKPITNTNTVIISYSDKNPAMAKLITNAIIQAYMDEILGIKLASINYSLQWMTSKVEEEREKLKDSELALQQYVRDNNLVIVENKLAVYPQKLSEFSSQLSKAQAERKEYESLRTQIKLLGKDYNNIETIPTFAENIILQSLRGKIFTADQNIKDLSKKYGHKHPVMVNANAGHTHLVKEKKLEVNRIIESTRKAYELAQSREKNLKELLASTKNEMLNRNERFTQYSIMEREVDMNRILYEALTSSIKTASVIEHFHDVKIWVMKKAEHPVTPSKPNKTRNLALGLLLGLAGGIGLAFFIEYLDNSVKDGKDIEQRFGLAVLGTIEELHEKNGTIETFILKQPHSPLAENYRMISSALLLSSPDHPPCSILITSMSPKEGKTSTTCNLARVLAQNNKKVLIIDCDMRNPRIHSLFNLPNSTGLSNYLAGNTEEEIIIRQIPDEPISLITSGPAPPNPAELLQSNRMRLLMKRMMAAYDYVLIDSPPVQRVTDSLPLSTFVDGVILITRSGTTTYDTLKSGLKKLANVHAPILGIIVNGLIKKRDSGHYGYHEYYNKE